VDSLDLQVSAAIHYGIVQLHNAMQRIRDLQQRTTAEFCLLQPISFRLQVPRRERRHGRPSRPL